MDHYLRKLSARYPLKTKSIEEKQNLSFFFVSLIPLMFFLSSKVEALMAVWFVQTGWSWNGEEAIRAKMQSEEDSSSTAVLSAEKC